MDLNIEGISVEQFRRPQHNFETAVIFGTLEGKPVVLKTFAYCPPFYRWLLGWLSRREAKILMALESIAYASDGRPWLPTGTRQWGHWGVLMLRMEGRPLQEVRRGELSSHFIRRLEDAVERLHGARVVHLDLKNSKNILVRDGEHPVLLDFAGCLSFRKWPLIGRALTRLFGRVDQAAILKWKQDLFPETITPEEKRFLRRMTRMRRLWPFPVRKLYRRRKGREIPLEREQNPAAGAPTRNP